MRRLEAVFAGRVLAIEWHRDADDVPADAPVPDGDGAADEATL